MPSVVVVSETCPSCASEDVRAVETGYFALELDRADDLRSNWVGDVEFTCRDCGVAWA